MFNASKGNLFELFNTDDSIKVTKANRSIEEAIIPDGVTVIGERAFAMCKNLKHVVLPVTVSVIEKEAFRFCSDLRSVVFENGAAVKIMDFAFAGCSSLEEIDLLKVNEIGNYAFSGCAKLRGVNLSQRLEKLSDGAFYGCESIESVDLPDSVKQIGEYAFYNCKRLVDLTMPGELNEVGSNAFQCCSALKKINIIDIYLWYGIRFKNYNANPLSLGCALFVGDEQICELKIPDGITEILPYSFAGFKNLRSVIMGDGVVAIGEEAFCGSSLNSVVFSKRLMSLGAGAFCRCASLEKAELSAGVVALPERCFAYCSKLESVVLSEGVREISKHAFSYCPVLKKLGNTDGLLRFCFSSIEGCHALETLSFSNKLKLLDNKEFSRCSVKFINYSGTKENWVKLREGICDYYDVDAATYYKFTDIPHESITVHCSDGELTEKYYSREDVEDECEGDWGTWVAPWLPDPIKKMWS